MPARSWTRMGALAILVFICIVANACQAFASNGFEEESRIAMAVENYASSFSGSSVCRSKFGEKSAPSCPVNCFRPDPVCGVDGVTYWCGCAEAYCSGVQVAELGFCSVGNGGTGLLSGQALLLVHIVWLILLGFVLVIGLP